MILSVRSAPLQNALFISNVKWIIWRRRLVAVFSRDAPILRARCGSMARERGMRNEGDADGRPGDGGIDNLV